MSTAIFRRDDLTAAALSFGDTVLDLAPYATTGVRSLAIAPSGCGKTNAGVLITEQLAAQGWICVLMDAEGELGALELGETMKSADKLDAHVRGRHHPILIARVRDAAEFLDYGRMLMRVVDEERKPVFLMVDEGQIFSTSRRSNGLKGEASALLNDMVERGRKRALDLFITAHRFSGTIARSVFQNKNLTFVGRQEDPTAWSALAPQFKGTRIGFSDLAALSPGEFFMFSRRGIDRVTMPMANALAAVAPKAIHVRPALPSTFSEWDRRMREISDERLLSLTPSVVGLLGTIAGLNGQQLAAGDRALREEIGAR